jgi:putative SOS response-associated peptidase YedK
MCGRVRSTLAPAALAAAARVSAEHVHLDDDYHPNANAHPGNRLPIVVMTDGSHEGATKTSATPPSKSASTPSKSAPKSALHRELWAAAWGLVPSFTKPDEKPNFFRMFNARAETVAQKGIFSRLSHKRCVVLADGYYEWKEATRPSASGRGKARAKVPYFITRKDSDGSSGSGSSSAETKPMFFAALYDTWHHKPSASTASEGSSKGEAAPAGQGEGDGTERLHTVTILTQDAPSQLAWLHDRTPVILNTEEEIERWLNPSLSLKDLQKEATTPNERASISWHACHPRMNSLSYHSNDAADPVPEKQAIDEAFKLKQHHDTGGGVLSGKKRKRSDSAEGSASGSDSEAAEEGSSGSGSATSAKKAKGSAGSLRSFFVPRSTGATSSSTGGSSCSSAAAAAEGVEETAEEEVEEGGADTKDPAVGRAAETKPLVVVDDEAAEDDDGVELVGATSATTRSAAASAPVTAVKSPPRQGQMTLFGTLLPAESSKTKAKGSKAAGSKTGKKK